MGITTAVVTSGLALGGGDLLQGAFANKVKDKKLDASKIAEDEAVESQNTIREFNRSTNEKQIALQNDTNNISAMLRKATFSGSGRRNSILGGRDNAVAANPNAVKES